MHSSNLGVAYIYVCISILSKTCYERATLLNHTHLQSYPFNKKGELFVACKKVYNS